MRAPWAAAALIQCYALGSGRCWAPFKPATPVAAYLCSNDYRDVIETLKARGALRAGINVP
jgi:hypothetical protein